MAADSDRTVAVYKTADVIREYIDNCGSINHGNMHDFIQSCEIRVRTVVREEIKGARRKAKRRQNLINRRDKQIAQMVADLKRMAKILDGLEDKTLEETSLIERWKI
jgi:hypothetical protein